VPDAADGVFETLLVRDGRAQACRRHLSRLGSSVAEVYGLALPDGVGPAVRARAAELRGEHRLRVDAIPRESELEIALHSAPLDRARPRHYALSAVTVPGGHGPHKWRDRRALEGGGLIVDADGSVLEAAWANVWIVDGPRLITPPADGRLLPGVTRARLLEHAPSLGLAAIEQPIALEEARAAPALMLTSSVALAVAATLDRTPVDVPAIIATVHEALATGDWED
jgi:para-aminobenzoate synthetase/4-amino-4-deoxychorismate lyase